MLNLDTSTTRLAGGWRAIRRLVTIDYPYTRQLDGQRARALQRVGYLVALFAVIINFVLSTDGSIRTRFSIPLNALFVAAALVLTALLKRGIFRPAAIGYVLFLQGMIVLQFLPWGAQPEVVTLFAVPIVITALVIGGRWTMISAVLSALGAAFIFINQLESALTFFGGLTGVLTSLLASLFGLAVIAVISSTLSNRMEDLARSLSRVSSQLDAAAVVSESATHVTTVSDLLDLVVERIQEAYGFYHAQVFLLDEDRRIARLEASTGRAGEELLARAHSLPVGSQSVIGQVTQRGEPVVVNDTTQSETHRPNPLLPRTRAELALPLIVEGRVIGALDVQSVESNVFQPEDVRSLQVMAAQLATAIQQTRLVAALQTRIADNQRLYDEAQANLSQIEELSRRLTREGWSDYLRARRQVGTVGYTLFDGSVQQDSRWSASMRQAYQGESSVVLRQDQEVNIAALPLRVRGEVIGVLEIERDGDEPWTEADLELAETLVERLALAVENARLFEQATLSVEREQFVNRVGQEVQSAQSIDDVLQTALNELSTLLGASRGVVQISPKIEPGLEAGQGG